MQGDKQCVCEFGELRKDNDIKQDVIAKELNVSQVVYSRYETETVIIPLWVLKKLARFYNTSIDYLIRRNRRNDSLQKKNLTKPPIQKKFYLHKTSHINYTSLENPRKPAPTLTLLIMMIEGGLGYPTQDHPLSSCIYKCF